MTYNVTLIPGDGIGPEISAAAKEIIDASGVNINWEVVLAGEAVMAEHGTPLPDYVLESIKRNRVALKGPITTPIGGGFRSVNVTLRQKLNLYANVRPARTLPGISTRYEMVDIIVVRENTEDLY
ncbi:isocitrate dehydrogenase, partial [Peptococcaceae bacterium SCADC1_2_3]